MFIRTILLLLITFTTLFPQGGGKTFDTEMQALLSDSFFTSCYAGIKVHNLTKGTDIYAHEDKKLMNPASNMKIITSAAGLVYLGPRFAFTTTLGYTGTIEGDVLKGDLVIVGRCDPDFKIDSLNKIFDVVTAHGIREIKGDIVIDISYKDSLFWGEGWMWDDDGAVTSPFMSALNVYGNTVKVMITPRAGQKPLVTVYPVTGYFEIVNEASTGTYSDLKVWRDYLERTNRIFVRGTVAATSQTLVYFFNVWKPELYMATLVKEVLARNGLKVNGKIREAEGSYQMTKIYEFQHAYAKLINQLNKKSDNLYTEMVLLALGGISRQKNISFNDGKKYLDSLVVRVGRKPGDYRFADGSGVSRYNVVSADLLTAILNYLYEKNGENFSIFFNSLPIGGVDGTLAGRMKSGLAYNNVRAKTGSLSGVSSLSGYLKAASGDMISFSILMQNFTGSAATARSYQDRICELIAKYN